MRTKEREASLNIFIMQIWLFHIPQAHFIVCIVIRSGSEQLLLICETLYSVLHVGGTGKLNECSNVVNHIYMCFHGECKYSSVWLIYLVQVQLNYHTHIKIKVLPTDYQCIAIKSVYLLSNQPISRKSKNLLPHLYVVNSYSLLYFRKRWQRKSKVRLFGYSRNESTRKNVHIISMIKNMKFRNYQIFTAFFWLE